MLDWAEAPPGNGPDPDRAQRQRAIGAQHRRLVAGGKTLAELARAELPDKVLGCWCPPRPCHGEVLARLANEESLLMTASVWRLRC